VSDPTNCGIESLIDRLDGSGSEDNWAAAQELRSELGESLPDRLLLRYPTTKRWAARTALVYHCIRYASTSTAATDLALLALADKSRAVRYRACMLLACSQRRDLVPKLQVAAERVPPDTKADLMAAIDAIESENQDYFVDRDHSGMVFLVIH